MVKICSKCGMKNSNNSYYCVNCSSSLVNAEVIKDEKFDSSIDEHSNFEIKDSRIYTNVWRPFVYLGIFFAVMSFFIGGLLFMFITIILGGIAVTHGEMLGLIPIFIAFIPILLMFVF